MTDLLGSPATSFLVISTLEVAPAREAEFFLELLAERHYHVAALVLNKVLPDVLLDHDAATAARTLPNAAENSRPGSSGRPSWTSTRRTSVTCWSRWARRSSTSRSCPA